MKFINRNKEKLERALNTIKEGMKVPSKMIKATNKSTGNHVYIEVRKKEREYLIYDKDKKYLGVFTRTIFGNTNLEV